MKELLAVLGMVILTAPIAAVFLFGRDGSPRYVPPEQDSQREEATCP